MTFAGADSLVRLSKCIAVGVLVICLTSVALRWFVRSQMAPYPETPRLAEKLSYLESVAGDVDVLVLGSSRVYRDFVPEVFDQSMNSLGCPVRSFNLGVPGLSFGEARMVLDRLAEARDTPFPWLLLADMQAYRARGRDSRRNRYYADPRLFSLQWQDVQTAPLLTADNRRFRGRDLIRLYLNEFFAVGALADLLNPLPRPVSEFEYFLEVDPASGQGYVSVEKETAPAFLARRERYLDAPPSFDMNAGPSEQQGLKSPDAVYGQRMLFIAQRLEEVSRVAASAGFVMFPRSRHESYSLRLETAAQRISFEYPLINLNRPDVNPHLADPGMWFDYGHLNTPGAEAATRLLAQRICALMLSPE